ncbi:MAG TPA: hypothetical protein VFS43_16540 [Polyangiaceae bacterium]|nr:hypothetical protein [Polyangiaceae bacterium]
MGDEGGAGGQGGGGSPLPLDPSFGKGGVVLEGLAPFKGLGDVILGPDGSLYLYTETGVVATAGIVRLLADGSVDAAFGEGGFLTLPAGYAWAGLALQPDGKLVFGGQSDDGATDQHIAFGRFGLDGKLDSSFGEGGLATFSLGTASSRVSDLFVVGDRVLAVGNGAATTPNFYVDALALRLRPDGTLDTEFHAPDGFAFYDTPVPPNAKPRVDRIDRGYARPDGALYACGEITEFLPIDSPYPSPLVVRYTPDGQLDPAFGEGVGKLSVSDFISGSGCSEQRAASCLAVVEAPDGKVIVAGEFYNKVAVTDPDYQQLGGRRDGFVARLLPDGSPDPSFGNAGLFNLATPVDALTDIVVLPDGALLAGGRAGSYAGNWNTPFLMRITAQGALDPTFGAGGVYALAGPETATPGVRLARQPDGKIVVGIIGESPVIMRLQPL